MVRSTASGQSCAIDPNGRVIAMAEPFKEAWINVSVPIVKGNTPYNRLGDWLAAAFSFLVPALLIFGIIWYRIKR
jgi:apolipoprotein N-acyltransferase